MAFRWKRQKATTSPITSDSHRVLAEASYIYHEEWRYEADDRERRGQDPPESIYATMMGARAAILSDRGEEVLPWRHLRKHLTAQRSGEVLFSSVFDGFITPTASTDADPDNQRHLREVAGVTFLGNRGHLTGLELSHSGAFVASLEWTDSSLLAIYDSRSGERRHLTRLERVSGYEAPLWSPDDAWILIGTHPAPTLVRVADGSWLTLAVSGAQVDWWPQRGTSTLLLVHGESGAQRVATYSLETGESADLGPIAAPDPGGLDRVHQHLSHPRISPDGTKALIGFAHGLEPEYARQYGSRLRIGVLDLESLRLTATTTPFIDADRWIERCQSDWKWLHESVVSTSPVTLADSLSSSLQRAVERDLEAEASAFKEDSLVRFEI